MFVAEDGTVRQGQILEVNKKKARTALGLSSSLWVRNDDSDHVQVKLHMSLVRTLMISGHGIF